MTVRTVAEAGHQDCAIVRHIGECGALWSCDHPDGRVFWEPGHRGLVGPLGAERVAELRAEYGPCI